MTLKVLFVKPCGKFNDNIHHKGAAFLKKIVFSNILNRTVIIKQNENTEIQK